MTVETSRPPQSIPGYEMRERLGSGGYGEVWKALAPGRIEKAVKVIFGQFDGDRAAREMKALNRIKEVRHPFLLSLERIEVVDSQLVIVTELADMSLKDRFLACRGEGGVGIPRDELLVYLRDAADALDHMSAECGLQHLDVKPQNLLLVGGRVKVADFGLVYSIDDASLSLTGGLTPIYAPPELFEGAPSQRSDQYSLAIVYQEMLTGKLPFSGTTASQLMAQHLHHRPRLSPLPPGDRAAIARALSKAAADRFANCRAMVDCLAATAAKGRVRKVVAEPARRAERSPQPTADAADHTLVVTPGSASSLAHRCARTPAPAQGSDAVQGGELPSLTLSNQEVGYRPVLFLGIGGTATRVLRHLRRRLHRRFGTLSAVPALQTLLLDTDLKAILQATQGAPNAALAPHETVAMPLRSRSEYEATAAKYLRWLSRRWLYNIPRSRRPDGRRPLGRVALMDHGELVFDRIREALATCTNSEAVAKTAEATRHPLVVTAPRVFVVASIAGGTGGGMVIDVAYAVRMLLQEMGLADDGVCGILLHTTGRDAEARDLAIANSYACLAELHHYSHPSLGYPGAPECGIPAFDDGQRTFPTAYLVDLGEHLSEEQFDAATQKVAEYLYLDAATPVGTWLDTCRGMAAVEGHSRASAWLRSFGLCRLGGYETVIPDTVIDRLCYDLIRRWQGPGASPNRSPDSAKPSGVAGAENGNRPRTSPADDLKAEGRGEAERLGLRPDALQATVTEILSVYFGGDFKGYAQRRVADLVSRSQTTAEKHADTTAELVQSIHAIMGPLANIRPSSRDSAATKQPQQQTTSGDLDRAAQRLGQGLCDWLFTLVDRPRVRTTAATQAAAELAGYLQQLAAENDQSLTPIRTTLRELAAKVVSTKVHGKSRWPYPWRGRQAPRSSAQAEALLLEYINCKFQEHVLCGVGDLLRQVADKVTDATDALLALQRELATLAEEFEPEQQAEATQHAAAVPPEAAAQQAATADDADQNALPPETSRDVADRVLAQLPSHWPDIVTRLEARFDHDVLATAGGLGRALTPGASFRGMAAQTLRQVARETAVQFVTETNVADVMLPPETADDEVATELEAWLAKATPRLCNGGYRRLVTLLRDGTDVTAIERLLHQATQRECSLVRGDDGDVVFCYEVEQLPLDRTVEYLTEQASGIDKLATRLHTRVDIAWTPLATP